MALGRVYTCRGMRIAGIFSIFALLATSLGAQEIQFAISTVDGKSRFYLGELIELELTFRGGAASSAEVNRREQDRVGRVNGLDEFLVDPAEGVVDPLRGLDGEKGGMGGVWGGPAKLRDGPVVLRRFLNDWVRFQRPGFYTLRVKSGRVSGMVLESNALRLEIVEAPKEWVAAQIAGALRLLDSDRVRAVRVLRSLVSVEAHRELVRRLDGVWDQEGFLVSSGVLGSPFRSEMLAEWEARLVHPEQGVSERFLKLGMTLAGKPDSERAYRMRLWEALPQKSGTARGSSLEALLSDPNAPWAAELRRMVARDFASFSEDTRQRILYNHWPQVRGVEMMDGLRASLASKRIQGDALLKLREVSPLEGEAVVRAELREGKLGIDPGLLLDLPESELPELDEFLVGRGDGRLIARYASAAALPRVRAWFESWWKGQGCRGPLLFYFLRHDAVYGKQLLRQELSRDGAPLACYDLAEQYGSLGPQAFSPALEEVAIEALRDPKVPVKRGAAELLRRHGSVAARAALWDAMEYLMKWWTGRELNHDAKALEMAFAHALVRAEAWRLDDLAKSRLRAMCRSELCLAVLN